MYECVELGKPSRSREVGYGLGLLPRRMPWGAETTYMHMHGAL